MKCPKCWTEKAYRRPSATAKERWAALFLLLPMKCHHCFHKFYVLRLFSLGKRITPPEAQHRPTVERISWAQRQRLKQQAQIPGERRV